MPASPPVRGVIFDCDGVLVDSEKISCGAWLPLLEQYGIQTDLAEIETFIGRSDRALLEYFAAKSGRPLPASELMPRREQLYFEAAQGRLRGFAGLPQAVDALTAHGLSLAVASSGSPPKIRFNLQQVGLADRFGPVCSAVEVPRGKPAPDLFLLAAERLGLEPAACAVIEDAVPGVQGAVAAGMRAYGFTSSHDAAVLKAAGADATFASYDQLPDLIL